MVTLAITKIYPRIAPTTAAAIASVITVVGEPSECSLASRYPMTPNIAAPMMAPKIGRSGLAFFLTGFGF